MKHVFSALLSIVILFTLFGCGEVNMNPGITSVDLVDNSETQQRWLRLPDSNLVINPESYSKEKESGDFLNMPLNIGILDEEGNLKKTIDDAMFFMEKNSSNGKGGEVIFTGNWTPENINFNVNKPEMEYEPIGETGVKFWIKPESKYNAVIMTFKKRLEMDFDQDIFLNVNVIECVGMISLKGDLEPQHDIRTTGLLSYNLTEFSGYTGKKKLSLGVYAIEPGNPVAIDLYEIRQIPKGFHYGNNILTTWAPYSLVSNIGYENETSISVTDVFASEKTIVRKITGVEKGVLALAGKYNGSLSYDNKNGCINITGDGYKYTIATKRKANFRCFATEDDMKNDKNEITENYPDNGYWLINFGAVNPEDSAFLSITVDSDNSMTFEEMAEMGKEYLSEKKYDAMYTERIESWNEYIAKNELTSEFFKNLPAEK